MLRSLKELHGYSIMSRNGEIGHVDDFYFDDQSWIIRYMIVDTGPWIFGRRVLIAPHALDKPEWTARVFPVNLFREQIKNSPKVDTEKPVSRQYEVALHEHYNWPMYWNFPAGTPMPPLYPPANPNQELEGVVVTGEGGDPHLRRMQEVLGYDVEAADGKVGVVGDFIVDDDYWIIRYVVLDSHKWLPGRKFLIAPDWIDWIRFDDPQVAIELSRQKIKASPEFDPTQPLNRKYEEVLFDYYGRPQYWREVESEEFG